MSHFATFDGAIGAAYDALKNWGQDVPVARWQGVDTKGTFRELLFFNFSVPVDRTGGLDSLREEIKPNLPWADDHFAERVGGKPTNPGEAYKWWPHWMDDMATLSLVDGKFSHTYQERLWPSERRADEDGVLGTYRRRGAYGVAGNLYDVVKLLRKDPLTRQAYVPIWYPEDTGATHGARVPCTIGYFFIQRNGKLHMRYHIRSCDFNRYFRDDIYMAVRLQLWMVGQLHHPVMPGNFLMDIDSLHVLGRDFETR